MGEPAVFEVADGELDLGVGAEVGVGGFSGEVGPVGHEAVAPPVRPQGV